MFMHARFMLSPELYERSTKVWLHSAKHIVIPVALARRLMTRSSEVVHLALTTTFRCQKAFASVEMLLSLLVRLIKSRRDGSRACTAQRARTLSDSAFMSRNQTGLGSLFKRETHVSSTFNGYQNDWTLKGGLAAPPQSLPFFKLKINLKCCLCLSCEMNVAGGLAGRVFLEYQLESRTVLRFECFPPPRSRFFFLCKQLCCVFPRARKNSEQSFGLRH